MTIETIHEQITEFSGWSNDRLEECLIPPRGSLAERVSLLVGNFFCAGLFFIPLSVFAAALHGVSSLLYRISGKVKEEHPLLSFAKNPVWNEPTQNTPAPSIPIGFATADFHDTGPLKHPNTRFGKHYLEKRQENFDPNAHFPDMWQHPERWISRLTSLNCKIFRFSIPRDLLEPIEGQFDEEALKHLQKICLLFNQNGIEMMVTLDHFNHPLYQNLDTEEGINSFTNYAVKVSKLLYAEGVRKIMTFNEIGVEPFEGHIHGDHPPCHKWDFEGAAKTLENILKAHTKTYHALKAIHPDLAIGLSHDPIRFRHYNKWLPVLSHVERMVCRYLTKANHEMVMSCLKNGHAHVKVPFCANYEIRLSEKPPLDFIGLQYYTDPLLNFLKAIPDEKNASVTRNEDEGVSSYRFRLYAQGLASAILELSKLNIPIHLSEIGIDTGVDKDGTDLTRMRYFGKIFQVVQKAIDLNMDIRSLYLWTLIDNFDWSHGWEPIRFGFYHYNPKTDQINPRPIVNWLKNTLTEKNVLSNKN